MSHTGHIDLVSLVVRTVGGRPREIRRAIASVDANTWRPLEVVVVYQGPEDQQWQDLQKLPQEFPGLNVRILINLATGDRRAENLNIGWENAQGRYIGFLDDDDTLSNNHVELLVASINLSGRAWAYTQVILRKENAALEIVSESSPFRRHAFSLKSLWTENFLPIHSILIDRSKLNPNLLQRPFHEELDRSEDWDFLLQLAFHHEPAVVEEFTATYHVSTAGGNTNLSLIEVAGQEERERLNREAWARCKAIVEARKSSLAASIWWSSDYFGKPTLGSAAQDQLAKPSITFPNRSLHKRVIRKLIRLLESLL